MKGEGIYTENQDMVLIWHPLRPSMQHIYILSNEKTCQIIHMFSVQKNALIDMYWKYFSDGDDL